MPRRDNPVTTYLSDEEKAELSRFVEESPDSQATVVRDALLEYLDFDRYARIESQVRKNRDLLERTLSVLEDDEHTHTRVDATASVPEKARTIARRIHANHDTPVSGADVEIAIEDIGGGVDRTVVKYKDQLKKRGLLYEHPMQPVWTDEREVWVARCVLPGVRAPVSAGVCVPWGR